MACSGPTLEDRKWTIFGFDWLRWSGNKFWKLLGLSLCVGCCKPFFSMRCKYTAIEWVLRFLLFSFEQAESKCMLYFQHGLLPTTRSMFHVHLKAIFVCDLFNPTCRVDSIGAQTRISYGWKPVGYLKLSLENLRWKSSTREKKQLQTWEYPLVN